MIAKRVSPLRPDALRNTRRSHDLGAKLAAGRHFATALCGGALDSRGPIGHPALSLEFMELRPRANLGVFGSLISDSKATNDTTLTVGETRNDTKVVVPRRSIGTMEGKRMKRREFLKVGGAGLAATAVAAPAIAQSMPEVKWRLAASWPKSLDTLYGGCEYFVKRVAEVTDNKFQIQSFAAGEIVPGLQVLDAVSNGTVEMGNTALYYYWGKNPAFTFGTALPFGLNTRQHISWLLFGGGSDMLNDLLKEYKCLGIPTGSTGAQMGGWFRKEIKSMADFQGLKFRVGGFAGTIIAKVGGVAQQIAGGDIYPALEKGTIDAAEWVGPYDDEKLGFVKVAKYYYYPGWWEGTGQGHNVINLEKWNALPKHYQVAIDTASRDTFTWVTGKYDYVNPPALKRLIAAGAILRPFPQEVLETCYTAASEIYADLSKSNPHFNKLYSSLSAYRSESLAWMQVAELSFDSFMMRMRTRT
jgi:TRAP-type mannitol/chloroaromatic compound transport system substrate-binding protein